jgi:DNA repair exonuclease SbcCD ATPase subunit
MTYVREQSSTELAVHMRSLQKMPGWHDPLADRLWQEVEALKAEVAGLRTGYEAYERVNAELKAENEALRQSVADHKACIASDNELFREANLECNRYRSVIVAVGELLGISKEEQDEEEATQEELIEAINELWGQVRGMREDIDGYKSEYESLHKDAKRFQYWVRCWSNEEEANLPRSVEMQMRSNADFEIEDAFDAAMGKGEQS